MNADKLRDFMNQVSSLRAAVPGTGMSSGGMWGAMSAQDEIIVSLRKNTAAFAAERSKPTPDQNTLKNLADEVEGSLQGLHSLSVIDDSKFDSLLDQLHTLKNT
jgi:hypothetical protein